MKYKWIAVQLGSREHYAIPRALRDSGRLELLLTDAWVKPRVQWLFRKSGFHALAERYHADLAAAQVHAFLGGRCLQELRGRVTRLSKWGVIIERNKWFQNTALSVLRNREDALRVQAAETVVFAYSYAALGIFRYAKALGMKTILGQIDPGPFEEQFVAEGTVPYQTWRRDEERAPTSYWRDWAMECELADRIAVNSEWAANCLVASGVAREKMVVLPLAFEGGGGASKRLYPRAFSADRPLRLLFFGQVILRKGVAQLLEAIRQLGRLPVQLTLVGPLGLSLPEWVRELKNVEIVGPVARSKARSYYGNADVFVLPTISDGFAITQLEAMCEGLPCIVSRNCGRVVADGITGIVLNAVTVADITNAIVRCIADPEMLQVMSDECVSGRRFDMKELGRALGRLESGL